MIDLLTTLDKRPVREAVNASGLLSLGSVEHRIQLLNVSLTGFLAELEYDDRIQDFNNMLQALRATPVIDFYFPVKRLAGEAKVARVEVIEHGFRIGLEFCSLTYDIDELLYKRRAFQKHIRATGNVLFNGHHYTFKTENVSVYGMVIRILDRLDFETGSVMRFSFDQLELHGEVQVVWGDRDYNSTLLGVQFLHKVKSETLAIPDYERMQAFAV
ncbi:MAG: PilZ domain-containing protein [Methylomonas sp.]